jgi:hypothetical protein
MRELDLREKEIMKTAQEFANRHKRQIVEDFVKGFAPIKNPSSFFMAGSPGAGKTEFSKEFVAIVEKEWSEKILRIDPDDFRKYFVECGYTGENSYLFQGAISVLTDSVHDYVLKHSLEFLLDGTFASFAKSDQNIQRSLSRNRKVYIYYIYQLPEVAWKFTVAREKVEGRKISKEVFVNHFLSARENVCKIKQKYGNDVDVSFVFKNYENDKIEKITQIGTVDNFEKYFEKWYNREDLEKLINYENF